MDQVAIDHAAATRPYPGEEANGDAWYAQRQGDTYVFAVIDGLGHGVLAAEASQAAVRVLEGSPAGSPMAMVRACHEPLRSTRGAAITVVTVSPAEGRLTYAGVGNVEARICQNGVESRLVPHRGIAGAALPTLRDTTVELMQDWLLLIYSDGISSRFRLEPDDLTLGQLRLAQRLVDSYGRATDDATALVAWPVSASFALE